MGPNCTVCSRAGWCQSLSRIPTASCVVHALLVLCLRAANERAESCSKPTRRVLQQANTQNPAAPVKRCDEPISCDPAERSPAERLLQSVSWRATQKKNSGRNPGSTVCGKILFKTESMTDPVDPTSGTTLEALAGLEMDVEGGLERARKDLRAMVRRIWWGGC